MNPWTPSPLIYEINTWAWLNELTRRYNRRVTLGDVPGREWDRISEAGFDAVWLMGVWNRSPEGESIARKHKELQSEYGHVLPDFSLEDVVGSPYAVQSYTTDTRLGGPDGLAAARCSLSKRGISLLLDFVPNHVALDHPWIIEHPEYFIQGDREDLLIRPDEFFQSGKGVFAHGRDPYFPPWGDTVQVNAFRNGYRRAAVGSLRRIAAQCDGVRCDMAMLLMNRIFEGTWGTRAGIAPEMDFWPQLIQGVRSAYPGFLFVAEAYWDTEGDLQQQGFDYCYDKRLYDYLVQERRAEIQDHLLAKIDYQKRLLRFIENHDEARSVQVLGQERSKAAAVIMATLPGAKLFHQGQLEGRRLRVPIQLGRWPAEEPDLDTRAFYETLLGVITPSVFHRGEWRLCGIPGWSRNRRDPSLFAWCWRKGGIYRLVVVNYGPSASEAEIRLPWGSLRSRPWILTDFFTGSRLSRYGDDLIDPGLPISLGPWGFAIMNIERSKPSSYRKSLRGSI